MTRFIISTAVLVLTVFLTVTVAQGQISQNQSWYFHSKPKFFENKIFVLIKTDSVNNDLINMDTLLLLNSKSNLDYKNLTYDFVKFDKKTKRVIVNNVTTQFTYSYLRIHIGDDVIITDLRNSNKVIYYIRRTPDNMIYKLSKRWTNISDRQ